MVRFSKVLSFCFLSDKPKIAIKLGRSINAHQIKQGDDVYFECKVMAFPRVRKVNWLKNVSTFTQVVLGLHEFH